MLGRRLLHRILDRLEGSDALDPSAEAIARVLRTAIRPGPAEDTLSGTALGHPVHPALVGVPIGAWTAVNVLDAMHSDGAAARLQAIGIISAVPAAATGASDWLSTSGAERRVGLIHAVLNYSALALHTASWLSRRSDHHTRARVLAYAGSTLVGAAGWLGGHLVYALGVGVDTTAFLRFPTDWTDAAALDDVPDTEAMSVEIDGVAILLALHDGAVVAFANRCTHRGGPLAEGVLRNGCVSCPWHDSVFDLADGAVVSGPATRPQPRLDVRTVDGRVQVRRGEERSLRSNPVGR